MSKERTLNCGNITITAMVIGPIQTNVYVVSNAAGAFVVDPADDCPRIMNAVRALASGALDAIVVTHAHFDHTGALAQLRTETGAPVIASALDAPAIENPQASASSTLPPVKRCTVDRSVCDGDVIELCGMRWQVLMTPGHTKGSMCLYLPATENGGKVGVLFSGDTLFKGAFGRTDFPGGSMNDMWASLNRLRLLPANTLVFPGHMQSTEIGAEERGVFQRLG